MAVSRWQHQEELEAVRLDVDPALVAKNWEAPVTRMRLSDGKEAWLVTGWSEARQVFADASFSRTLAIGFLEEQTKPTFMLDMDPPDQTRVRRKAVSAFTHREAERLRSTSAETTDRLLDAMIAHGEPADLIQHLAVPLPLAVICQLLGVPFVDRDLFHPWSDVLLSLTAHTQEEIDDACGSLDAYMADLIARSRAEPADNLLSTLVHAQDGEDDLTEEELVHLGASLLISGYPASASQIANCTYVLLTRPELWRELLENPGLLPTATEELLRYVPLGSNAGLPRVATQDVELGGVLVRAGEMVMIARPAANRDHTVFSAPNEIILNRTENPHLAFGYGIHRCLGAHLARMELQIAIGHLLHRFPGLHLAVPEEKLNWKTGLVVRGLYELPVAWTSA